MSTGVGVVRALLAGDRQNSDAGFDAQQLLLLRIHPDLSGEASDGCGVPALS